MANPNQNARSGRGQYVRTAEAAARDAEAAELRAQGWTYQKIADELGFGDKSGAQKACRRAIQDAVATPGKALMELEVARLETLYDNVLDIFQRDHVLVSHGHVVHDDSGQPIIDDEMKLKAFDRLLRGRESFRRLLGLDAPNRVSVEAEQLGREISRLLDTALGPDSDDAGDDTDA
ncbi:hypothetical protein SGFS_065690 [Streptomyces graminofaciens]|uniref:Uncharacterized protein n=1 Tax=Streptomyces graminofaciens TaxID=68212 RepID=A0ABN5VP89_9ACTN|nr:hypothetical protein [Streptomyces graminofaciens]BBC35275.1 hypothetical protein SGFS_065690 [Streptomyces graminofaciens]